MRLSKDMIKYLSDAIAANLKSKGLADYEVTTEIIATRISEVITANMVEEDNLGKDAEKLLAAHETEISQGQMDRRKMLELTKQKLAKDRGIVL